MTTWLSPNNRPIVATAETVACTAWIGDIEDDGTPVYAGESRVEWDSQEPVERDGKILFIDDNYDTWTFDELHKQEDQS